MDQARLIEIWEKEEQQPFQGWDFSHLQGRMFEEQPPWSYAARAGELLRRASAALDLGTGGGERLLALREDWPAKIVATEDYPPNVRLATERLGAFGVRVVDVALTYSGRLPFADGEYDLVLNRHSGFNPDEVARIVTPGGWFLTEQVHGLWAKDLLAAFGVQPQWPDASLEKYLPALRLAGVTIVRTEDWTGRLAFTDVGAIVYYLRAVPWLVPGFSVETHLTYLLALQRRLESGAVLSFTAREYLIEARKVR
jgi:SAM-dependent methyltransferase